MARVQSLIKISIIYNLYDAMYNLKMLVVARLNNVY
jgi:hypothetical protein